MADDYGGLAEKPLAIEELGAGGSAITKAEFEKEWFAEKALNRPP